MESQAMFLNCSAYLDNGGAARCGQPAEVEGQYTIDSTDGPLESARIRCPRGHHFDGPIQSLTMPSRQLWPLYQPACCQLRMFEAPYRAPPRATKS